MFKFSKSIIKNSFLKRNANESTSSNFNKIKICNFNLKNTNPNPEPKMGVFKKLKMYGKTGIIVYMIYYIAGFIAFYFIFKSKVINSDNLMQKLKEKEYVRTVGKIDNFKELYGPQYIDAILAFICNEIFDIVRTPTTFAFLAWWFKKVKK